MKQIQLKSKDALVLFVILISLLSLIALVLNQWMILSAAQSELKEEESIVESLKLRKDAIDRLKGNEVQLKDRLQSLQYMIPSDKGHVSIFAHFESAFIEHNIQVIQMEVGDQTQQEGYREIPIKVSFRGEYKEIMEFIYDLRLGKRPFRVDELYMDREGNHPSQIHCDLLVYGFSRIATN